MTFRFCRLHFVIRTVVKWKFIDVCYYSCNWSNNSAREKLNQVNHIFVPLCNYKSDIPVERSGSELIAAHFLLFFLISGTKNTPAAHKKEICREKNLNVKRDENHFSINRNKTSTTRKVTKKSVSCIILFYFCLATFVGRYFALNGYNVSMWKCFLNLWK